MRIIFVFAIVAVCISVDLPAEQLLLSPDRPQTYTVKRGDTLWDIAGQFLQEPRRWREIWAGNSRIRNPHRIYPGDLIELKTTAGGPVLSVRARHGPHSRDLKLSPSIRMFPHADAKDVKAIPLDAIQIT